jgi:hypothetical protein
VGGGRGRPGLLAALILAVIAAPARGDHGCDDLGDEGWSTVASHETVAVKDGAPFAEGGNWYVTRTVTVLPFCNYINAVGNYSLRSYSLEPEDRTERVMICRAGAAGTSTPVAPYTGPCPPK